MMLWTLFAAKVLGYAPNALTEVPTLDISAMRILQPLMHAIPILWIKAITYNMNKPILLHIR